MSFSKRIFRLMLSGYPRQFRREFGPDMVQVFNDCYRAAKRDNRTLAIPRLWIQVSVDALKTVPSEHWDNFQRDDSAMNKFLKDAIAAIGCLAIIAVAFVLLSYGRKNEVSAILMFGSALDALVTVGIIGNVIIFLLVKARHLAAFRTAVWTFAIASGALLLVATIVGSRVDPQFSFGKILIGYVVSFVVWVTLHWVWSQLKTSTDSIA